MYTPGPWSAIENPGLDKFRIQNKEGTFVAETPRRNSRPQWQEEARANAYLIAAAPELLAALSLILQHTRERYSANATGLRATNDNLNNIQEIATRAIANAKSGQPAR